MDQREFLVMVITLALAAAFLFMWMRRDRGIVPEDRLPEVLHEPLNGREGSDPARAARITGGAADPAVAI